MAPMLMSLVTSNRAATSQNRETLNFRMTTRGVCRSTDTSRSHSGSP